MLSLTVSQNSDQPLADQIVAGIKRQIDDRHLRPGTKLPSIRNFAEATMSAASPWSRLTTAWSRWAICSRAAAPASTPRPRRADATRPAPSDNHKRNEELVWLIRRLLEADENTLLAGGPWLPNSWLDEAGIRQSLNVLARKNGAYLLEYGHPFGYLPLREHLALMLAGLGITAHAGQILLTQGTSQALELVIRYLLKPGDAALVDDPGLLQHVRQSAPAGRRDAGGAAQSRRPGRRHSREAGRGPPAEGLFHPVGDAEPDRNRHEPACGVQGAAGRRAPQLHCRGGRHLLRSAGEDRRRGSRRSTSSTA